MELNRTSILLPTGQKYVYETEPPHASAFTLNAGIVKC
jgi:hypothetical protein